MLRKDLEKFSSENPPKDPIGRTKEVQERYDKFRSDSKNIENFKKLVKKEIEKKSYYFHENDFSYNVEEGILHKILWCNDDYNVEKKLEELGPDLITYWENLDANNSIKDTRHIHVLVEAKKKN